MYARNVENLRRYSHEVIPDEIQTAELIELGFEKPTMKNIPTPWGEINEEWYSIGELIEMLPMEISNDTLPDRLGFYIDHNKMWAVDYSNVLGALYSTCRTELRDALYDMIVKLKEEGVI